MDKLIERLDALSKQATRQPWNERGNLIGGYTTDDMVTMASSGGITAEDREFIVAIVNAWPEIRHRLLAAEAMREEVA